VDVKIEWINSEDEVDYSKMDGILVPDGFGKRGSEGKMEAIKYARINMVPFLGICYGFQLTCVEYARNICMIKEAESEEFYEEPPKKEYVIKKNSTKKMIVGSKKCLIKENTLAYKIYKNKEIFERCWHRYVFNLNYKEILEKYGLIMRVVI